MEHFIFFIIVWAVVLIVLPLDRIKELRYVAVISIIWMIFVDNLSTYLGYYSYEHILFPIGKASLFQLLGLAGIGFLMINWLDRSSLSKLIAVLAVAIALLALQYTYSQLGAFTYGSFDLMLSFIHSVAALSIFTWASLAIVGEEKVYNSNFKRIRKFHVD